MGLSEANLTAASGFRAALNFDPSRSTLVIKLPKPLDQCSLQDVEDALRTQTKAVESMILEASKKSELEEVKGVNHWKLTAFTVEGSLPEITERASKGQVSRFSVTGKQATVGSASHSPI